MSSEEAAEETPAEHQAWKLETLIWHLAFTLLMLYLLTVKRRENLPLRVDSVGKAPGIYHVTK